MALTTEEDVEDWAGSQITDRLRSFFGADLDPKLAKTLQALVGRALPSIRRKAEDIGDVVVQQVLRKSGKEHLAPQVKKWMRGVLGYGIAAFPQIVSFWDSTGDAMKLLSAVNKEISEVSEEGRKDNFLTKELRSYAYNSIRTMYAQNIAGLIDVAPQLYIKYQDDQVKAAFKPIGSRIDEAWKLHVAQNPHEQFNSYDEKEFKTEEKAQLFQRIASGAEPDLAKAFRRSREMEKEVVGTKELVEEYGTLITPVVTGMAQKAISGDEKQQKRSAPLHFKVKELIAEIRKYPTSETYNVWGGQYDLPSAIAELFIEAHQHRYKKAAKELPQDQLYEVSNQIASAIAEGKLNPTAITDLVGQKNIISGPLGEISNTEQTNKILDNAAKRYSNLKKGKHGSSWAAKTGGSRQRAMSEETLDGMSPFRADEGLTSEDTDPVRRGVRPRRSYRDNALDETPTDRGRN